MFRPVFRLLSGTRLSVPRRAGPRDVSELLPERAGGPPLSTAEAREWCLVLAARGLPYVVKTVPGGYRVHVPVRRAEEAARELAGYLGEKVAIEPAPAPRPVDATRQATLWAMSGLAVLFSLLLTPSRLVGRRLDWKALGAGDTTAMLDGQWWRAVTALTLHADPAHLFGNLVSGAIFMVLLCRETGVGAGFFLAAAAGTAGNALKALIQGPGQHFLGASTAVFAALGLLAGLRTFFDRKGLSIRDIAPAGAGVMLLAMLGMGEEEFGGRIDMAGHGLGFAAGFALGALSAWPLSRFGRPGRGLDATLGLAAVLVLFLAWGRALSAG